MAYVNPGELRYEIEVVAPERVRDENGHYRTTDAKSVRLRAAIRAVRAADVFEDGAARARETIQCIVRYRRDLNTDMEIRWRGRRYEIESIDPTPFASGYMRIRAVSYDSGVGS